jgi:hypothetical protein
VKISLANDPSHVLHAKVIEVSKDLPLSEELLDYPGYRDLAHEAHEKGLLRIQAEFQPLLSGQTCPRCKTLGILELSQIAGPHPHVRY